MERLILKARAKVNLSLDVLGKRADGYHDVKMLMQTVDLYDSILIDTNQEGIKIKCNLPYVPTDNRNIVYKIAQYMIEKFEIKKGVYINLRKNIPVAAGLGGGSVDGAAVLIGLNKIFDLKLSREELMKIGGEFGADIPYCILGGTALAEGLGEKLTILPPLPKTTILVCKPMVHISTAYVYTHLDLSKIKERPDTDFLIKCIEKGDVKSLAQNMVNVMETVTAEEKPVIRDIKNIMIENGAMGALMSGSGTSVFGLFESKKDAHLTAKKLSRLSNEIFVTNTFNSKYY